MFSAYFLKYRNMILCSIFFFYFGCGITLSLLKIDCDSVAKAMETSANSEYSKVEYVVLILSAPENVQERSTIRGTWINFAANMFTENGVRLYKWNHTGATRALPPEFIKFYFAIGVKGFDMERLLKLTSENARNNDLLLLDDLEDHYLTLSDKTVQSMKWLSENMKQLKYVIKCDDDSFVRVDLIVRELEAFAPDMNTPKIREFISYKKALLVYKGLYWGYFNGKAKIFLSGKWQESEWFLCDNYLPYALGGGYVVSRSIVDFVARNADILSKYKSEDVSMGVWTAPLDGINRVHDTRFDTQWRSRGCENNMLIRHKQTPTDMLKMYKNLVQSKGERLCTNVTMERKAYVYNWDVLPSACCK
ncbi:beta-1,3-galactosyltransferase 6 [Pectinophora gossypiella]|uniref:beta-1,3-galactosyltransferase 6 n=1 Tax=Pectinophora gossypiella TaxID=13191 RepID=UPI00214EDD52|nr:beta-1,3-galactosyltransferase 6 [Pectinophora gossypiella]